MVHVDEVDIQILKILSQNSRTPIKDIAPLVHLSSPAVSSRIDKLESLGIIEQYTILINQAKLGKPIYGIVNVMMKVTPDHVAFQTFVKETDSIIEAFRVSGHGCYSLKINVSSNQELTELLDQILSFGNYQLNLSIAQIK